MLSFNLFTNLIIFRSHSGLKPIQKAKLSHRGPSDGNSKQRYLTQTAPEPPNYEVKRNNYVSNKPTTRHEHSVMDAKK